jgi:hypothetical protein
LVRKVHTLAIETKICISLNWLKSLSKFIRVCHSLSCFRSTTFTIIRFQCGFSGKSVFSGINHAGESYVCIYFLLDTHCPCYTVFQRKTFYAIIFHMLSFVVEPCFHKWHALNYCATKCWSLFSSKRSLFFKSFQTS